MRALAIAVCLVLAQPAAAANVTDMVFGAEPMRGITEPVEVHYRYEVSGSSIDEPFASRIDMDVREVAADGGKKVWIEMFDGPNARRYGPLEARDLNQVVLIFLARDVKQMGDMTGGAAGYFQQQLRRSFNGEAAVETIEVTADGQKRAATKLTIHPFRADPNIGRFPKFKEKTYEFTVADWVPGGIWQLAAITPDVTTGEVILQETVTFERTGP